MCICKLIDVKLPFIEVVSMHVLPYRVAKSSEFSKVHIPRNQSTYIGSNGDNLI